MAVSHYTLLVWNGHLNAAKYFITEQNCDPNIQGKNGSTPLHYASQGGHMNIIQYLITELGCDPTTQDCDGSLPLHNACLNGHLIMLQNISLLNKTVIQKSRSKWIIHLYIMLLKVVTCNPMPNH